MQAILRHPPLTILATVCVCVTACPENDPQNSEGTGGTGEPPCVVGELGCECNEEQCFPGLECVSNVCIDPQCTPGTENCICADGELCFGELECDNGICKPPGEQCEPYDLYRCSDGDVHWFDSCGGVGDIKDECNEFQQCTNTSDTTAECVSTVDKCGDQAIDPGEDCDGSNLGGETCQSQGLGGGGLGCSPLCTFDTSQCDPCGNGLIEPGEDCDGPNLGGKSCGSLGFGGGNLACTPNCSFDTGACDSCGNGVLEPGEQCDGGLLGGASCMSLGYSGGGNLSCTSNCQYDVGQCESCDCDSGPCCDGCDFLGPQVECESDADAEYGCPSGTDPGDDVSVRYRGRYCSGGSSSCDGNYGSWGGWQLADACSDAEHCSPGEPTCSACSYSYDVTQYECSQFSSADGSGPGGGEIMRVCATTNPQTGYMTVKARKYDGSTFSSRPYQVRVSATGDAPCGPNTYYFAVSNSNPVNIGTTELTFSFPSQWLPGQTTKAYCVTASTKPGDLGYDANNPQQQSWWYSDKAVLTRQCN